MIMMLPPVFYNSAYNPLAVIVLNKARKKQILEKDVIFIDFRHFGREANGQWINNEFDRILTTLKQARNNDTEYSRIIKQSELIANSANWHIDHYKLIQTESLPSIKEAEHKFINTAQRLSELLEKKAGLKQRARRLSD
jgi:type I restriction-modification system DNA methylase subunit